jgi:protein gp37
MIFVNSMSDLFHEQVPDEFIAQVFGVMANADQHVFQVLTKRPERMRDILSAPAWWADARFYAANAAVETGSSPECPYLTETQLDRIEADRMLPNCWLGTSIENRRYVHRADLLRATPAAVRFISAEPLLGPLGARGGMGRWMDGYEGPGLDLGGITWVICGGESGPRARPMRLAWARALRDVCAERGVAFFLKQLGGARAGTKLEDLPPDLRIREYPRSAVTA